MLQRIKDANYRAHAKALLVHTRAFFERCDAFESKWTQEVGTLFGVPVQIRPSFALLCLVATLALGLAAVPALFLGLLIHEFAHVHEARRWGIKTVRVSFNGLGAVALMPSGGLYERPSVEWRVAIAGPLASFVLAIAGYTLGTGLLLAGISQEGALLFGQINLALGLFNLTPILPMDGGRVVRGVAFATFPRPQQRLRLIETAQGISPALLGFAIFSLITMPAIAAAILLCWGAHEKELEASRSYYHAQFVRSMPAPRAAKPRDPWWRILGFGREPRDMRSVKQAYRLMVQTHHPDKGGTDADMRKIAQAYADGKMILG